MGGLGGIGVRRVKLDVALAHGECLFIDYALEIPGLVYYADMSDCTDGRLPISTFFPSGHGHDGGTFKWYGATAKQRPRQLEANPFPAHRRRHDETLRSLARHLCEGKLHGTFNDVNHFLAQNVKAPSEPLPHTPAALHPRGS